MASKSAPILHATIYGHGPTVVLLHGFLSSADYWENVGKLLEKNYRVIAVDLLGFGRSPKPKKSKYDHDAHIKAIDATLNRLGVTEPFTLIGHSMGSLIALRYGIVHVDRVKKLVLTNLPVMLGRKELRKEIFSKRLYRFGLEFGINRVTWILFRTLNRLRLLPRQLRRNLKKNQYFLMHTAVSRLRSFYNVIGSTQVIDDLANIQIPTQLLSGKEDRAIYLKNIQDRINLSPMIQHAVYATGHHIPCQMPERVVEKIRS